MGKKFFLEKKKKMVRRRVGWSTPPLPLISLSFVGLRGKKSGLTPTLQQMGGFWAGEQETPPHLCRFRIVLKKFFFGKKEKNGEKASWVVDPSPPPDLPIFSRFAGKKVGFDPPPSNKWAAFGLENKKLPHICVDFE